MDGYDATFGYMLKSIVAAFSWSDDWTVSDEHKTVTLHGRCLEERNDRMKATLLAERERNTFLMLRKWTGENFAVYGPDREIVLSMERNATPLFGVITYGIQLLACQKVESQYSIWISRRAQTKSTFPGLLDSTVGGSLPTGETPHECLLREADEEASLPPSLTGDLATNCGVLNYVNITDERGGGEIGLVRPEVQYLYEMQLPSDVTPIPGDTNEVESFRLMMVDEIKEKLAAGEFTPANGCVVLDFFIRHGILTPENEKHYIEIVSRLRRRHVFPTA